ncbi:histidine kinase dimerization/phospho-acceptor domain-containing protein [Gloeobacter violaceus]|uniref:histidine kinase n=1 Tax=Gloeobacter violaceus (strain ATCC 29082 / PCC 7421) TaxID=251221 RepID=Q7NIB0_GLOVI|nr:histidine kinase dimerization/phospho-acceptor domain-containing protein [Gloeobacter violaceus]BAC90214.1 gsr2273 [Gloeobacter violaceus PCC 7421]
MPEDAIKPVPLRDLRHDIGEPLTAIRLYAEVLRTETQMDSGLRQELLEAIEGQAILLQQRLEEILGEAVSNSHR